MSDSRIKHAVKPSFFVPHPTDNLQLNPTIQSPKQVLGNHTPRTLQFLSTNPHDLVCSNPTLIEARIQEALKTGEFTGIDQARRFVPHDPLEREIYSALAQFSEEYGEKFLSTGVGVLGAMTGQRNQAVMTQMAALNEQRAMGKISRGYFQTEKKLLIDAYVEASGRLHDQTKHV